MTCTTGYFLLTANYPSSMLEGLCGLEFRIRVQSLPSGLSSILPAHINQERASILVCRTTLSIIISCIHCLLCTRSGTNLSWLRGECAFYNAKPANCIVKTHARAHTHYATGVSTLVWVQDSNRADKYLVWTISGCRNTVDTSASGKKDLPRWPSHLRRCYTTYLKAEAGKLHDWFCHSIYC